MQKKASEPEGPEAVVPVISLVALPCGDAETASGGTQQHQNTSSEASSRYSHSMTLVLPYRHSSCIQFSVPSRDECRQVTPRRVSSASGTKAGTTPKTFFKLKGIEFSFLSQRARQTAFGGSISPKTSVLKLKCPFACKPPAAIVSESARAAFASSAKPQVAGMRDRQVK